MKVFPIEDPVDGERVLATHPEIDVFPDRDWRRRINSYKGRSVTHTALRMEQDGRGGRLATLGQLVSPGVLMGMEAARSQSIVSGEREDILEIAPGFAVSTPGETIRLARTLRAPIRSVRTYWLSTMLDTIERGESPTAEMLPPAGSRLSATS